MQMLAAQASGEECTKTVDVLKKGPENVPMVIRLGEKFTDPGF